MSGVATTSDAVREVVDLLVTGNHLPNIRAVHDAEEVVSAALAYFSDVADLDTDIHKGMQIEMLRDIARRAAEVGDFPSALKAVAQLSALTAAPVAKPPIKDQKKAGIIKIS